jgi:hypothetical protein
VRVSQIVLLVAFTGLAFGGCAAEASRQASRPSQEIDRARIDRAFAELEGRPDTVQMAPDVPEMVDAEVLTVIDTGPRPGWAHSAFLPNDAAYYHGIGTSRSSSSEARARALGDLVSEIEVRVTSEVKSYLEESGDSRDGDSQILSRDTWDVKVLAEQTIRDPVWVGHWSGQGEFWSYTRISKERYRAELQRQLAEAKELAIDHLRSARRAETEEDVVVAARGFVRGLDVLSKFLGHPIAVDIDGLQGVDLGNELGRGVDRMLGAIELDREGPESLLVVAGKGIADDLVVRVRHDGRPLAGVPVRFQFTKGQGELLTIVHSDGQGRARSRVSRIASAGTHVVEARVDLVSLAFSDSDSDRLNLQTRGESGRSVAFHIGGFDKLFYIGVTEENLGVMAQDSYFERIIRSRLAAEGAVRFVQTANEADLLLQGGVRTRFSSKVGAVTFCYADISVRLTERETGTELYATRQTSVKGADKSERDAALRAIEKAADEIVAELLRLIRTQVNP